MTDNTLLWIIVIAAFVALAIVLYVIALSTKRHAQVRRAELQHRFGPEYERAIAQYGGATRAERELAARERRVHHFRFRELTASERDRFTTSWTSIQARFVDEPASAVLEANELIKEVMRARGYPADDFDQRVADLSVDHAGVVQHYRAARELSASASRADANTEELRQALVHFRALFADLLREPVTAAPALRESHA